MSASTGQDAYRYPPNFGRLLMVESAVPCARHIESWLIFRKANLTHLVQTSHRYERQFLAWETVRKTRNPFFVEGTGFEGYFVGQDMSPEAVIDELLHIGRDVLLSNERLYRSSSRFQSVLMKTLAGDMDDDRAIDVWATQLGAILGRLRRHVYTNQTANQFQTETYRSVTSLPDIVYRQRGPKISQTYLLPAYPNGRFPRIAWDLEMVKPQDYDAALVVWSIGRFGHPLIRECLRESGTWAP